jgi:hypothetical protein
MDFGGRPRLRPRPFSPNCPRPIAFANAERWAAYLGASVPEPSTWAMMLLGFVGLGFAGYRARVKTSLSAA